MTNRTKTPYIICLNPETGQIFSLDLLQNDVHIENDVPGKVKEKSKITQKQIQFLRDSSTTNWWFRSEACENYRKRKIQSYLIHQDCLRYPTFEATSRLSLAFSHVNSIEMHIDISDYHEYLLTQIQEKDPYSRCNTEEDEYAKSKGSSKSKLPLKEIPINVSLLTGATEVIKALMNQIYRNFGALLKPLNEQSNKFILKAHGFREHFFGDLPLMCYDRVRESLRGLRYIKVKLIEVSNLLISESFPVVVHRDKNNIVKGIYDPPEWKKFEDTPLFVWYPPNQVKPKGNKLLDLIKEKKTTGIDEIGRMELADFTTPQFRKQRVEKKIASEAKKNCISTGEVDFPFQLRVCGVENLQVILTQFDEGATDNGYVTPQYVTRSVSRKDDAHGAQGKKKKGDKKKKMIPINKLGKSKKDGFTTSLQHEDHGVNGQLFENLFKDGEFSVLPYLISVEMMLYYGCTLLRKNTILESKPVPFSFEPRWFQWLSLIDLPLSHVPKETRVCFNLKIYAPSGESQVIATTTHLLFDMYLRMRCGVIHLNLWPFYKNEPRFVCQNEFWFLTGKGIPPKESEADDFMSTEFARLVIQLPEYHQPIFWSLKDTSKNMNPQKQKLLQQIPTSQELALLKRLLQRDPLNWSFTEQEKEILIICRHHYKTIGQALPIFLSAIDWSCPEEVAEAHEMLDIWEPIRPQDAVTLLDARFPNREVRIYAIERVSELSDDDLCLYLLELTMALLYEEQHYSALGEFLIERSLANPYQIGHEFYWMLRSQLHIKPSFERITLIIEQFLMLCGNFRQELQDEIIVNDMVTEIAEEVPKIEKSIRLLKAREKITGLKQQGLPSEFTVSLDTRMRGTEFLAEECKVMDSKKLPLWLTIKNSQPNARSIKIIFKTGDDLKQDQLTLQLIRIMDKIWLDHGLDLRMKPYRVLSTADQAGMLEVVLDSETTSDIHTKFGGGAIGALNKRSILNYIAKWNPDPESLANAKENFIRSCAGYAVATFCLGIGDRHSGNIMLTKSGHLFHIDFGHFLGNFKSKFGINRERTAFVFTEEMAYVMGGKGSDDFEKFQDFCTKAYNLIRENGNHLISLFIMMIIAGMPELSQYSDIDYLKNQLSMDLSDQEATNKFIDEIYNSLNSTFRRIDNLFHALKRG